MILIFHFRNKYSYIKSRPDVKKFVIDQTDEKNLTFKVFIEYLVELPLKKFDIHWLPIYLTCKPCLISYDLIAKTETMARDSEAILREIGITDKCKRLSAVNAQPGGHSSSKIKDFFSYLDRELVEKLYKVYEMDFILFDYSPNEYFDVVQIE